MSDKLSFSQRFMSLNFFFKIVGSIIALNGIGVVLVGIYLLVITWLKVFEFGFTTDKHAGANIFKSMDFMLLGIVFIIFGISIKSLVKKTAIGKGHTSVKDIFDIEGFLHQKHFLWQTLATTLVFVFLTEVFKADIHSWTDLIIPISIALITASMYFMKKSH